MRMYVAGGLGNQMFEYAFARNLNIEYGYKFIFDFSEFNLHAYEGRKYGLDNLNINNSFFKINESKIQFIYFKLIRKFLLKNKKISENEMYFKFNKLGFIVSINSYKYYNFSFNSGLKYIYGNFQSWKYFNENKDTIKKELKVKTEPSKENAMLLKEIDLCSSVCVHIRRGDYCNPKWKSLQICNYKYYKKGMSYIAELIDNPVFYVFSNSSEDINWIKENYDFSRFEIRYVDMNNADFEELRLMYSCKHFIISNSTFSWWAQFLSENINKIVIAPSIWNRDEDATDLYEKNWHLIEC